MKLSDTSNCRICGAPAVAAGNKRGRRTERNYQLSRCTDCGFAWVIDPWTDFTVIYDEAYYEGRGSDPSVDYAFEYAQPHQTIRCAEWKGLLHVITSLEPGVKHWLDYGCGNSGLVRYVATHSTIQIQGFDTGAWANRARNDGLPILNETELAATEGLFDVITAIEVIEHVIEPVPFLKQIRKLLRPGGLLFLTTGNAACAPRNFTRWSYVAPEIHVSYFTPKAMKLALEEAGFRAQFQPPVRGFRDIVRFKVLKSLGQRRHQFWHNLIPWSWLYSIVDKRHGVSALPTGRAV